jgi:hypothetical protein
MREIPNEGRFVTDPHTGVTVDLDRVISMQVNEYADHNSVWFMMADGSRVVFNVRVPGAFKATEELLAAWKNRPSPKAFQADPKPVIGPSQTAFKADEKS